MLVSNLGYVLLLLILFSLSVKDITAGLFLDTFSFVSFGRKCSQDLCKTQGLLPFVKAK